MIAGTNTIFDIPDVPKKEWFGKAIMANLDSRKLKALKWRATTDIVLEIEKHLK